MCLWFRTELERDYPCDRQLRANSCVPGASYTPSTISAGPLSTSCRASTIAKRKAMSMFCAQSPLQTSCFRGLA
ncbi:unnamed protein product [Symbiodinium pilosum]|uniref:Uncharacterized protein n=1 Tax=Symbiodinium pilosum TaxID=2952 RepID=A0A812SMH7_SYMPI|nr:unnamed protein product [Symbiodinium pilosum]